MNLNGECTSLEDSPCNGWCTARIFGDVVCKGCGLADAELARWSRMGKMEKKLRVIDLAQHNYLIRHLQEER